MANVLIIGCGYVGSELARRLVAEGHEVAAVRRSDGPLPEGVRRITADAAAPDFADCLPPAVDYIFYTAAAGGFTEENYRRAYAEGPRNLVAALDARGITPQRIFITASTGVYPQSNGEWVDESSLANSPHFSGKTIREGEELLWHSGYEATSLRLAGIYGPGRDRLVRMVRDGEATIASEPVWANIIHRDDCAGALVHLMKRPKPGRVYVGVDEEPVERGVMLRWMASQLGVAEPWVSGEEPASARAQRSNKRCSSIRLRATGYRFAYPSYKEGYGALIAALV